MEWELESVPLDYVSGDVNFDGSADIADAVSLQKWLADDRTQPANRKAADLDDNGRLDIFDLCLMRKKAVLSMKKVSLFHRETGTFCVLTLNLLLCTCKSW